MPDDLGPPTTFYIRDVPERIREAYTRLAQRSNAKVADVLTRFVMAHPEHFGEDGQLALQLAPSTRNSELQHHVAPSGPDLHAIAAALAALAQAGGVAQRRVVRQVNAAIFAAAGGRITGPSDGRASRPAAGSTDHRRAISTSPQLPPTEVAAAPPDVL